MWGKIARTLIGDFLKYLMRFLFANPPKDPPVTPPDDPGEPSPPDLPVDADTRTTALLKAHNQLRADAGLEPLVWSGALQGAAQQQSEWQASQQQLGHTGENGSDVADRVQTWGYNFSDVGENVAVGFIAVSTVMDAWQNSPGHYANILRASFMDAGFGYAVGPRGNAYWTVVFGRRRGTGAAALTAAHLHLSPANLRASSLS